MSGFNFSRKNLVTLFLLTTTFTFILATPTRLSGDFAPTNIRREFSKQAYGNLQAMNDLYEPNPSRDKLNHVNDANKYDILGQNGNGELDLDFIETLKERFQQNLEKRQNFDSVTFQNLYYSKDDKCK